MSLLANVAALPMDMGPPAPLPAPAGAPLWLVALFTALPIFGYALYVLRPLIRRPVAADGEAPGTLAEIKRVANMVHELREDLTDGTEDTRNRLERIESKLARLLDRSDLRNTMER